MRLVVVFVLGIHLWVLGQADVSWTDDKAKKRTHFEYEIYMKDCIILWGKGSHCFYLKFSSF